MSAGRINWSQVWKDTQEVYPTARCMLEEADIGEWTCKMRLSNYPPQIDLSCHLIPSDMRRALVGNHVKNPRDEELLQVSTLAANIADVLGMKVKWDRRYTGEVHYVFRMRYGEYNV